MKAIYELSQKAYFWLIGILYFMLMESIALYYQYVLQFFPCALCVQVRAWVVGAIISSVASIYFRSIFWIRFFGLLLTIVFISGAFYTSYYAWGVENGTVISTCSMGAGFPSFMPLDQWIPFSLVPMDLVDNRPRCGLDFLWSRHFYSLLVHRLLCFH